MTNTRIVGDFSLTPARGGLIVKVLDYHAAPTLLTYDLLREFGLVPDSDDEGGSPTPSNLPTDH